MRRRRARPLQNGFTLIELLIVVAIIGLLVAMLIPNFLDALQKAKQKSTMANIRLTGGAAMSWLTDQSTAAAAGASATQLDVTTYPSITWLDLKALIVPQYIQEVPIRDGWKVDYDYRLNTNVSNPQVILIRSSGRDATFQGAVYETGPFDPTDYNYDIVWADGFFVRWPQKTS